MRPPAIHVRVGPDTHPPNARIEAWRAALGFSHDTMVAPADRSAFRASFDGHRLGAVLLADIRAVAHTAVRDRAHVTRQAFDAIALDVFLEGGFTGVFGSRAVAVGPDDALLLDVRDTMRIDLTDHRCLTLIVPRPLFRERVKRVGAVGGRVFPAGTPEARLLAGHLRHLTDVVPDLDAALAEAAGLAALDLLAACLRSAPRRRAPERSAEPASTLRDAVAELGRIERFVARNLGRPGLGPIMLCRQFRISRSTLYALVQPVGGVAKLVRRHRLAEAQRLLRSDEGRAMTTEALAQRCGFGNAQALRRALKDAGEAPPRAFGAVDAEPDAPPPVDPETSAWVDADFSGTTL